MATAVATFVSWRFGWRDKWELHPSELRCESSVLGCLVKTKAIPLSALAPAHRHFVTMSRYLLPAIVMVLVPGVLAWVYSTWIVPHAPTDWLPARARRLLAFGTAWAIVAACMRVRHVGFLGTVPTHIRYVRWKRRAVEAFAKRVIAQISAASARGGAER